MNCKTNHLIVIFTINFLMLNACKGVGLSPKMGCMPPVETFAYSVLPDNDRLKDPSSESMKLPPSPWQIESSLPQEANLLITRSVQGHTEIWLKRNPYDPSGEKNHEFMIYHPESKEWESISAEVKPSGGYVDKLFVTSDGKLWGQNFWIPFQGTSGQQIVTGEPLVSRFNDNTKQFEAEEGTRQFTNKWMNPSKVPYGSEVILDPQGKFWIFVHKDAIYSYDPMTQKTKRHTNIPEHIVSDPEIAPDGSIFYINNYYLENGMTNTINDKEIFQFTPESGSINKINIPLEPWPPFSSILVDDTGRLWLDSIGWREPSGKWFQIQRSPLFVTKILWSGTDYRWKTPMLLIESSDGRLWFRSDNGMTWLNPENEEWCWFTTEQTNIIEDQEHNLWMIADGKLYKNPLNQ